MKKLLILLFSILISFNSYGEWEEVAEGMNGDIYYLDKDSIKKHGGYVYFWEYISRVRLNVESEFTNRS